MNNELLGNFKKVYNMEDNSSEVKNQFEIQTDKGVVFQSYNSVIAAKVQGKTYIDGDRWDYSKTTGKYRNIFLGEDKKETEKKIKSGEYTLCNLN